METISVYILTFTDLNEASRRDVTSQVARATVVVPGLVVLLVLTCFRELHVTKKNI